MLARQRWRASIDRQRCRNLGSGRGSLMRPSGARCLWLVTGEEEVIAGSAA